MTTATAPCARDGDPVLQSDRLPPYRSWWSRRSPWVAALASAGCVISCFASGATHAASDLGGWVPVWSDEFDYSGRPDPSKWTVLNTSDTPAANAFVDGSTLILRVDENGRGANLGTGNTSTIRYQGDYGMKHLFSPGRLEVRASAVLLPGIMNIAWGSTDWLPWKNDTMISGEIDLFEIMGNQPHIAYMTSHLQLWFKKFTGDRERLSRHAVVERKDLNQFHIYTLEWSNYEIRMYLDGSLTLLRNYLEDPELAIFTRPRPLILNVYHMPEGYWGFSKRTLDAAKLPADMKVDYVRYYQCPTGDCRHGGILEGSYSRGDSSRPLAGR